MNESGHITTQSLYGARSMFVTLAHSNCENALLTTVHKIDTTKEQTNNLLLLSLDTQLAYFSAQKVTIGPECVLESFGVGIITWNDHS